MSVKQCKVCNTRLFEVEPFITTQQEIVEFARQSSLPENQKQDIIQKRYLHRGYYCPNGCTTIFVDGPLQLPTMTTNESMAIATQYSKKHLQMFLETHGEKSRIVICVFCEKFGGVKLEGETPTAVYHQPSLKPFCNKRISSAICSDSRIQALQNNWWYSTGDTQAECEYFEYGDSYKWIYKDVTGWSEYP